MMEMKGRAAFSDYGFAVVDGIYTDAEIDAMLEAIEFADKTGPTFRKSTELFAIRQFLREVPDVHHLVFNDRLRQVISDFVGSGYFVTKSIYFDKPGDSNWFVAYHQDLTVSVDRKTEADNFGTWTVKHNQFAVQPPIEILERNFTIRIHLDNTNEFNGALRVVPGSHRKRIYRPENIDWTVESEVTCNVGKGSVMLMRPLLLHASGRTTNGAKRRVIHIEFGCDQMPGGLQWSEYADF